MNTHYTQKLNRSLHVKNRTAFSRILAIGAVLSGSMFAINGQSPNVFGQGPAIAYPSSNWSYSDHSSTYEEGVMRGQASIINSAAELSYMNSIAAVNYQEAQRRAIENSVALSKAYLDRKEMQDEYLKRYRQKPFVGEARQKIVEYYRPKKLSATQFDANSGKIVWPHILRQAQYAPVRNEIDAAFANRSFETSGNGSDNQLQVKKLVKTFAALVRENLSNMSVDQYIEAQGFLRSVDAEAKLAAPPKQEELDPLEEVPNGVPAATDVPQAGMEHTKKALNI